MSHPPPKNHTDIYRLWYNGKHRPNFLNCFISKNEMNCAPSREECIVGTTNHPPHQAKEHNPLRFIAPSLLQDQDGSFSCLPCSSSSTSEANATECKCLGLNRAFQVSTLVVRYASLVPTNNVHFIWRTVMWLLFPALLYWLFFSRSPSFHSLGNRRDAHCPVQIAFKTMSALTVSC